MLRNKEIEFQKDLFFTFIKLKINEIYESVFEYLILLNKRFSAVHHE